MKGTEEEKRRELAAFLRARRGRVSPRQVGIPAGGQSRKVAGLRREEVAHRSGISVDYYTRLEQGRLPAPSGSVLDALARALLLDENQHDYLRQLADLAPARRRRTRRQVVPGPVQAVLSDLGTTPALVLGRFMNVLAWNDLVAELLYDFAAVPEARRNLLWLTFTDPSVRERTLDWDQSAGECVAFLRMEAGRYPSDPRLSELVTELSAQESEFQHWWNTYRVSGRNFGSKRILHPVVGEVRLDWQILTVAQERDQFLVVLPPSDEESRQRLTPLITPQSHAWHDHAPPTWKEAKA
ncbi:helix-turn-helix transcriptional regulator [Streptomyces sp. NPDC059861]|uniref:helix-turn-helix transcriptional regulator n=1 Tax=Streptomyces sp. NPDC059861 TaxID=3346974 RepID=UPI00365037CD